MNHHRTRLDRLADILNASLLGLLALAMLFPFYYIFAVSFTSYEEYVVSELILWPKRWVTDSYAYILQADSFLRSIGVTIYVTVAGSLVNLILTATMAYGITRNIWGQKVIVFLVLFTFVFNAGLIPTYLMVKETGLIDSFWALIIPGAINSFNLIVIRQFFLAIPEELKEAAVIDGANDLQIFSRIIVPLSKPAFAAFGLFYAVGHWNAYFNAILYLNSPSKWTVQVILRQIVILDDASNSLASAARDAARAADLPPGETIGMAAILLATLPILIVYPFLQKHFAKGVMLGSVKG
ncbi:putative aldouronate transport system permease protein [Paenibacillus sp. UNCCL117]|uniref:carbohydrate ABC transporter permease n=1 Tax=unclassified Paenibacillus TaxID=185978 RepID=UPI00088B10E5|nr:MULTISPECIES: carbohydrate ABC transporter permease [unclassified Paenibacillus]SDE02437.1 putative aldouronate transport system permease protein [Paenibacillus sp. cl123]SFW57215.1 putative aldouronate transport system permease protein [Paenibacillus sp. UNCCL117]